ncbi:odorant receptor 85b-like isoform X2 [Cephus cinctus]|uniref:Odorant receptor 85b-like isoform X2 n=1 Tax=Cephus cinctus TaxID=211228 RepID=A0AAJ7RFT2_CEPCN|nr:odorant receptor 85b-like isoform X2 [Cephus cinctus]
MRHRVEISSSSRETPWIFSSSGAFEPFVSVTMKTKKDKCRDMKFVTNIHRLVLAPIGLWPDVENIKKDKVLKFKIISSILLVLVFVYLPQTILLVTRIDDFDLVIQILATGEIVCSCALIKIIILYFNRQALGKLLKYMEEDWMNSVNANEETKGILLKKGKFVRRFCISNILFSYLTFLLRVLVKIQFHITKTSECETHRGLEFFFPSYFPKYMLKSPNFELIFIGQIVATVIVINIYIGCDNFLVLLIMHVSARSTILRALLRDLPLKVHPKDSIKFMKELGIIVRRHEHLNRFASMIDDNFNIILLAQMTLLAALLCFLCFQLIMKVQVQNAEVSTMEIVFLIFFILATLIPLYIYCYFGEILQHEVNVIFPNIILQHYFFSHNSITAQNEKIRNAAYECLWYIREPIDARSVILIMDRTVRPMKLTAGKFRSFTMSTFTDVFQNDQSSIAETVFLICAIFVAFAGLYGYCYVSELLCSENEAIGDTVYDSCWYNLSPKDARCLLFIISGSRKQLFVTAANFCYYSHSLFAAILKTLLGYISILMSISE